MASISFKDVEEALEKFQGTTNTAEWLKDFEPVAATCKWNDVSGNHSEFSISIATPSDPTYWD